MSKLASVGTSCASRSAARSDGAALDRPLDREFLQLGWVKFRAGSTLHCRLGGRRSRRRLHHRRPGEHPGDPDGARPLCAAAAAACRRAVRSRLRHREPGASSGEVAARVAGFLSEAGFASVFGADDSPPEDDSPQDEPTRRRPSSTLRRPSCRSRSSRSPSPCSGSRLDRGRARAGRRRRCRISPARQPTSTGIARRCGRWGSGTRRSASSVKRNVRACGSSSASSECFSSRSCSRSSSSRFCSRGG